MDSTPLAVAACLELLGSGSCTWERLIARRANSRIHIARCATRAIAIKECFRPATQTPDPAAAEREYTALARLAYTLSMATVAARPVAALPLLLCREHAAYAMTWVPGCSATKLLLSATTVLPRAAALGAAMGAWLRRLHSLRPLPERRNDFESKLETVAQHVALAKDRDRLVGKAAAALARHAAAAAALPMPASWVHGDMKSDNLLVDGDHIAGLDLQLVHENAVAYDLAPFLNHLKLLRWSPRGLIQAHKLQITAEAFLRAYSADAARWALPIAWLRAYLLLQTAAPLEHAQSLRALATRWPARQELACAVRELEAAAA